MVLPRFSVNEFCVTFL